MPRKNDPVPVSEEEDHEPKPKRTKPKPDPVMVKILACLDPKFLFGTPDNALVAEYLKLTKAIPLDIDQPIPEGVTTNEWFQRIRTENEEKNRQRDLKREACLAAMNLKTLVSTAVEMGIPEQDATLGGPDSDDPAKKAVLARIRQSLPMRWLGSPKDLDEAITIGLEAALPEAEKNTTMPRPTLPCTLEAALRYLGDEPSADPELLELAYFEWLLIRSSSVDFYLAWEERLLRNRVKYLKGIPKPRKASRKDIRAVSQAGSQAPIRPGYDPYIHLDEPVTTSAEIPAQPGKRASAFKRSEEKRMKSIEACQKELKPFDLIRDLRLSFRPGATCRSAGLRRLATNKAGGITFGGRRVDKAIMLQLARSGFQEFWKEHAKGYLELDGFVAKRRTLKGAKKEAGTSGVGVREQEAWKERTKSLCDLIEKRKFPTVPTQTDFEEFTKKTLNLRDKPAIARVVIFFSTLMRYRTELPDLDVAKEVLDDLTLSLDRNETLANQRATARHTPPRRPALNSELTTTSRLRGSTYTPPISMPNALTGGKTAKHAKGPTARPKAHAMEDKWKRQEHNEDDREKRERKKRKAMFKSVTPEIVLDALDKLRKALSI